MLASELIKQLTEKVQKDGDLEVVCSVGGMGGNEIIKVTNISERIEVWLEEETEYLDPVDENEPYKVIILEGFTIGAD